MDEKKLTPWFNGKKHRPARPGVYMLMSGLGRQVGYQKWDGHKWGPWYETAADAARTEPGDYATDLSQNDNWRGLRKRPNALSADYEK